MSSVTVAIPARGRSLANVVRMIAGAAEVDATENPAQLLSRLRRAQQDRPVTIIVDGLDEAGGDAALGIARLLGQIAADPSRLGWRVLVGTRVGARGAAEDVLIRALGNPVVIDLDDRVQGGQLGGYLSRKTW